MTQFWRNFKATIAYTAVALIALFGAFVAFPGLVVFPAIWLSAHVHVALGVVYGLLSFITLMSGVITLGDRGVLNRWEESIGNLIERWVMR